MNNIANIVISGEEESIVKSYANRLRNLWEQKEKKTIVNEIANPKTLFDDLFDIDRVEDEPEVIEEVSGNTQNSVNDDFSVLYISDPVPCNLFRIKNKYRYHIILRGEIKDILRAAKKVRELKHPKEVSVIIDIDPISIL